MRFSKFCMTKWKYNFFVFILIFNILNNAKISNKWYFLKMFNTLFENEN